MDSIQFSAVMISYIDEGFGEKVVISQILKLAQKTVACTLVINLMVLHSKGKCSLNRAIYWIYLYIHSGYLKWAQVKYQFLQDNEVVLNMDVKAIQHPVQALQHLLAFFCQTSCSLYFLQNFSRIYNSQRALWWTLVDVSCIR